MSENDERCPASAPESAPARFLTWLYEDQRGYIEIVAGAPFPDRPDKIDMRMDTRRWVYYDPERPDLLGAAAIYAAQLVEQYGNVYVGCRLYTRQARDTNMRS